MEKRRLIAIEVIVGVCLVLALYFFFPRGLVQTDSGYRLVMGTFARVVAVTEDSATANSSIEAALEQIENVDELMSDYKPDSQISIVNRDAFKRAVVVSESTFEVLQESIEFSKRTGGAFDITVGPLVEVWRSAADTNSVPGDDELALARSKVGYENLILDANDMSVRFAVDGMKLDLGGVAKGYAVDKAVEAMQKAGAVGGMVDVGGDIRCFGSPRGKSRWRIGLQDPADTQDLVGAGQYTLVLKLKDAAIATSGDYRRFTLIEGERFSHIIDRKTGAGAKGLSSVTVIAASAIDADALATAVSVMGAEKGLALIETVPKTEAILIPAFEETTLQPKYEFIKTTDVDKFISR
jgi:thiamine biosynthesis lipoprotein